MATIAELINKSSKQKIDQTLDLEKARKRKDELHLHALVTALKKHYLSDMDFTYCQDEISPRIKYKEDWHRLKVLGNIPYIIHSTKRDKLTFNQFIKQHP